MLYQEAFQRNQEMISAQRSAEKVLVATAGVTEEARVSCIYILFFMLSCVLLAVFLLFLKDENQKRSRSALNYFVCPLSLCLSGRRPPRRTPQGAARQDTRQETRRKVHELLSIFASTALELF